MPKRFVAISASVALFLAAPVAWGGDYHTGDQLICAECHVMHYSQTHGYNPDGSGTWTPLQNGPHEYLLRNEVNSLCLACHDNQALAPDVLGPNTGAGIRQGGALNQDGVVGLPPTGHTLNATDIAPGSNPNWSNPDGFHCCDCHEQHGYNPNGNSYRNLRADVGNIAYPGVYVSYAAATNDLTRDVYETVVGGVDISEVWFNEPAARPDGYAEWCKGCHTDFHGDVGGAELGGATGVEWLRHPPAYADIGIQGDPHSSIDLFAGHTNKVKVMHPNEVWVSTDPVQLAGSTPSCMSCHKAHGNQNAFGLIFMSGTGTVTEEGDDGTQVGDLCGQCHTQG